MRPTVRIAAVEGEAVSDLAWHRAAVLLRR
jgi:hypothetical protein